MVMAVMRIDEIRMERLLDLRLQVFFADSMAITDRDQLGKLVDWVSPLYSLLATYHPFHPGLASSAWGRSVKSLCPALMP
jgi:hypothetical protein